MSSYRLYLLICGLGSFAGTTAFTLNLIYQATVVGLSPLQLVLVGTVMETVAFLAQVPTGVIADLYSRRLSVIIGYLLMGAGLLVWGLFPSFGAILVANVVWTIGAVCVDGAEEAWAADEIDPASVTRAFVRGGQLGQAGSLLGIVAATLLAFAGLAVPIVAGGVLTLLLGVLLVVFMKEDGWSPTETRGSWRSMGRQVAAGGRAVRRSTLLAGIVAGTFFAGLSSEGFDRLSQPFLLPFIGTAVSDQLVFGGLAMIAALGSIGLTGLLGRHLHAGHPRRIGELMTAVQAATAVGMIGFGLAGQWWLAVGLYLVVRLLRDTATPIMTVWLVSATLSDSRATVFSIQAQADALGQIVGGPPAGVVGQRRSIGAGISMAGLFLLPAVALFALAARHSARQPAS
ncbi:DHA3 family tetracycline resistance protein-like MFS transporter [Actinoplanes tereljensis]|uniref:Tetracycline efflux MFS transporter TetA(P) n=1 Tax=Paractinoplanes tereljensis TaxID=571912 RepID=A0A919TQ99_9ACTN|nr:MFS transporter [Actinoplanes tereljensis]GIF18066.1 tetracycline efflux MFS transporter TetA(P) [Actinoplanes tereljensis]